MYDLLRPELLVLALLPLLIRLILPAARPAGNSLYYPRYHRMIEALGLAGRRRSAAVKTPLLLSLYKWLVYLLIVVALAGPVRIGAPEVVVKQSRSFLVLTDISTSMNEKDWPAADGSGRVTRWEGVRSFLEGFVGRREGDTMALIAFASQGYVQAPFTDDLELVQTLLSELEVGMAGQKTALGNAISVGIDVFDREEMPEKVMLLITDGVDSGSDIPPLDAAGIAADEGIRIYTLGIGESSSRAYDLDEDTLIAIAETTGARYFRAADPGALDQVSEQLNDYEPREYEQTNYRPEEPLYHLLLALALVMMLLPFLLEGLIGIISGLFRKTGRGEA